MTIDIGTRIRAARTAQQLSLRSVAQSLGLSPSLLSQIETGKTQPSVSTLYALVSHLGLSIDEILGVGAGRIELPVHDVTEPSPPVWIGSGFQRGEDNLVLEMENGVRWERLAVSPVGGVDALLVTYEPGAASSVEGKLMRHAGTEHAYLFEGELTVQLEFETHRLRAGDSFYFDSVRPHMYRNDGDSPARGLWFVLGRREYQATTPDAAGTETPPHHLGSAVDVLRTMDRL